MNIGNNIKTLRLRRGMTQEALALRLGVTPSAVGNYERGVSFPKDDVLERLFGALGCTPNELFGDCYNGELLTDEEYEHLEKYRALDSHGKRLVNACVDIELARVFDEEEYIAVAARKGADKSRVKLKKRKGKSIGELPDYYNKGEKK